MGVAAGPGAGQFFEVGAQDLGVEGGERGLPDFCGIALFHGGHLGERDELVEADQRVREGDDGVAGAEEVLLPVDVAR